MQLRRLLISLTTKSGLISPGKKGDFQSQLTRAEQLKQYENKKNYLEVLKIMKDLVCSLIAMLQGSLCIRVFTTLSLSLPPSLLLFNPRAALNPNRLYCTIPNKLTPVRPNFHLTFKDQMISYPFPIGPICTFGLKNYNTCTFTLLILNLNNSY